MRRNVKGDANVRRLVQLDLHVGAAGVRRAINAVADVPVAVQRHLGEAGAGVWSYCEPDPWRDGSAVSVQRRPGPLPAPVFRNEGGREQAQRAASLASPAHLKLVDAGGHALQQAKDKALARGLQQAAVVGGVPRGAADGLKQRPCDAVRCTGRRVRAGWWSGGGGGGEKERWESEPGAACVFLSFFLLLFSFLFFDVGSLVSLFAMVQPRSSLLYAQRFFGSSCGQPGERKERGKSET